MLIFNSRVCPRIDKVCAFESIFCQKSLRNYRNSAILTFDILIRKLMFEGVIGICLNGVRFQRTEQFCFINFLNFLHSTKIR